MLRPCAEGHYRFLPGIDPYSSGVVADRGHEIDDREKDGCGLHRCGQCLETVLAGPDAADHRPVIQPLQDGQHRHHAQEHDETRGPPAVSGVRLVGLHRLQGARLIAELLLIAHGATSSSAPSDAK